MWTRLFRRNLGTRCSWITLLGNRVEAPSEFASGSIVGVQKSAEALGPGHAEAQLPLVMKVIRVPDPALWPRRSTNTPITIE